MLDKYLVTSVNNSFAISNLFLYDDKGYIVLDQSYSTRIPKLHSYRNKFLDEYLSNITTLKEVGDDVNSIIYSKDIEIASSFELYNSKLVDPGKVNFSMNFSKFISNTFKSDNLNIFVFDEDRIVFTPFTRNTEPNSYTANISLIDMIQSNRDLLDSLKKIWIKQHGFADKFDLFLNHFYTPEYGINSEYLLRSSTYTDVFVISKLIDIIGEKLLDAPILITGDRVARNNNAKYSLITFLYSLVISNSTLIYVDNACAYDNIMRFETRKGSILDIDGSKKLSKFRVIKLVDKKNHLGRYESMASIRSKEVELNPYKNSLWSMHSLESDLKINLVKGVNIAKPNYYSQGEVDKIIIDTLTREDNKSILIDSIEHLLDHLNILNENNN